MQRRPIVLPTIKAKANSLALSVELVISTNSAISPGRMPKLDELCVNIGNEYLIIGAVVCSECSNIR